MQDATSWVGILVFACGLYCLYAAFMMKTKGVINGTILLGKDYQYKKCKNKEAYIKEVLPHLALFAVLTTAAGAADMINSFITDIFVINIVLLVAFIVEFIWFSQVALKAKKKYY